MRTVSLNFAIHCWQKWKFLNLYFFTYPTLSFVFCLSLYRHPFICILLCFFPGTSGFRVRTCGCQGRVLSRTICRTRPHGHHPRFCSSDTSTPSFFPTIGWKRSVHRLSHGSMLRLEVDSTPRTVSLIRRRMFPSPSRNLTDSLRLPLYGMRSLSPILLLLSSPHNIGSPNRYSTTVSPSGTSNLCLRSRVVQNS